MARCLVCDTVNSIHWHHTIPRSRGGEQSKQIPLCASCHTSLHHHALHLAARIRNPKIKAKTGFWPSVEQETRAQEWLQILTKALVLPIPEGCERQHLLSVNVSTTVFEQLKHLQLDLGLTQEQTVLYCLSQILSIRGINNVTQKTDLWFM